MHYCIVHPCTLHRTIKLDWGHYLKLDKIVKTIESPRDLQVPDEVAQYSKNLGNRDDIKKMTFPHDINDWNDEQLNDAKSHDVFEDLQKTAPILWIDGEKIIGYLRIRKWLQDNEK